MLLLIVNNIQFPFVSSILSSDPQSELFFKIPYANTMEEELMMADILTYLPSDILVKVGQSCYLQHLLRQRAPFLDNELSQFAYSCHWNLNSRK